MTNNNLIAGIRHLRRWWRKNPTMRMAQPTLVPGSNALGRMKDSEVAVEALRAWQRNDKATVHRAAREMRRRGLEDCAVAIEEEFINNTDELKTAAESQDSVARRFDVEPRDWWTERQLYALTAYLDRLVEDENGELRRPRLVGRYTSTETIDDLKEIGADEEVINRFEWVANESDEARTEGMQRQRARKHGQEETVRRPQRHNMQNRLTL